MFFESCGNVQTKTVPPDALDNVMHRALVQYEKNLKKAAVEQSKMLAEHED